MIGRFLWRPAGVALLAIVAAAMTSGSGGAVAAPVAITSTGLVTGTEAESMREFLGIRYAAPPVGPLRWMPPQPVPAGLATHTATAFGPHCSQNESAFGIASTSEDCLYLNVYTPPVSLKTVFRPLPVMVWIHGGSLLVGESQDFDPAKLVDPGNVVVVTINYRLGYLGFLAESGLDAEGHPAANYGLLDQQAALKWVKKNILGFGGDPRQVTIFGESAGGLSVLSNLISPAASGLFDRAIVESGAYALRLPTLAQSEAKTGAPFAAAVGCAAADTACLRSKSVQSILQAQTASSNIDTIVDGSILPQSINTALQSGQFSRVPLLNGSNHDEYRLFAAPYADLTAAEYPALVSSVFGAAIGARITELYPADTDPQPVLTLAAVYTDYLYACNARQVDQWVSKFVPTYAYEFRDPNAPEGFVPYAGYPYAAAHASEIQFIGTEPVLPGTPPLNRSEKALSATMARYWTNFARQSSPNENGLPEWRPYRAATDTIQSLVPPRPMPETAFAADHQCAFWAPVLNPS